ncbi:MAG: DNA polymerase III subunit gamma/tau [Bacteroidales bacterium]|nr:DNA polymerase III subunit gamma/tau [Bacteroidales bacterium]
MDNFIVSARKYRPSNFHSVVGQEAITDTLKNALKTNQVAQAFLFCGPRGVGKTTCARILAKALNCQHLTAEGEPCNECPSCRSFNESTLFNVFELDAASKNSVDDMRMLVDQVRIPPQDGPYKVYIIDEVHMLSQSAFNAFLKTLEEPPAFVKFIMATTEKHKILPTILSRCQVYDFKRITDQDIVKHLQYVASQEQINAQEDALRLIAAKADGALRDALSIFDQLVTSVGRELTYQNTAAHLNVLDQENYFRITDFIFSDNVSDALLLLDDILAKGFDGQKFVSGLSSHFRNLLMSMNPATLPLLEMSDVVKARMQDQARRCDRTLLIRALELTNQCDLNYKEANNKRLTIELCLMQINANYVYKKVRQSQERK